MIRKTSYEKFQPKLNKLKREEYVFSFLGAYKTQLFLQLKHSGLSELNTMNLWAGIDG